MTVYDYKVADVFTETPLTGNPVAVFLDARKMDAGRMQRVAREMQLSETVFVLPAEQDGDVRVRIFTPVNELPFAGHPTLGTAIALGETHDTGCIRMETAMGTVPFDLDRAPDGRVRAAKMVQPVPTWEPYDRAEELLAGLGLSTSSLPVEVYRNGPRHVFVGLPSIEDLAKVEPDQRILARLPDVATNCFAGSGSQWRMRMFSPAYGVVEDAATGSAAGPLAIHLARHGLVPYGRKIEIAQGVEMGRRSTMYAKAIAKDGKVDTVEVSGSAIVVLNGTMHL